MDDDVQLIKMDEKSTQNPCRMSEESLNIFQPAVVFLLLDEETRIQSKTLPKPFNCELTGYIQIYDMNAIFSAFHYQAIDHILPYTAKYNSVSWWFSQMYIIIKCCSQWVHKLHRLRAGSLQEEGAWLVHHLIGSLLL